MLVRFQVSGHEVRGEVVREDEGVATRRRKIVFVSGYRPETARSWRGVLPQDGEVWVARVVRDTNSADPRRGALLVALERRAEFGWRVLELNEVYGLVRLDLACFLDGQRVSGGYDDSWLPEVPFELRARVEARKAEINAASAAEERVRRERRAAEADRVRHEFDAAITAFKAGTPLGEIAWPVGIVICTKPEPHLWVAEDAPVQVDRLTGWRFEETSRYVGEYVSPDERGTRGGYTERLGVRCFPPKVSAYPTDPQSAAKAVWVKLGGAEAGCPKLNFGWGPNGRWFTFGKIRFSDDGFGLVAPGRFFLVNKDGTKLWGGAGEILEEAIRRAGGITAVIG
jgi:hypothetical protein